MKKEILKLVKNWIITWMVALIIMCVWFYIFIKARSTTNPWLAEQSPAGGLYVNNGDTLTAAKWNTLVNKTSQISYDWTATAISWTLDIDYRFCKVENPAKGKAYNCDGSVNTANIVNNTSYTRNTAATDAVDLLWCPTGYVAITGGWYAGNYMRESRTLSLAMWRIASAGAIWNISLLCMKIK